MEILQRKKVNTMSTLSRYNLLSTMYEHHMLPQHYLGGELATADNELIIQRACHHLMFLIEDLLTSKGLNQHGINTRLGHVLGVVNQHDFSLIIGSLKAAYDILINHISGKNPIPSFLDFKGQLQDGHFLYDGRLFCPIKEDITKVIHTKTFVRNGVYCSNAVSEMKNCSAYLLFLSKLNFSSVGLEDKALDDYNQCEIENISNGGWSDKDPIILGLHHIIIDWCKDWYYDKYRDHHGSGAVADSSKASLYKYLALKTDQKLEYAITHSHCDIQHNMLDTHHRTSLIRRSKLIFVPKNISKLRSISMEPATLQYHQQGVMKSLMRFFEKQHELKTILHLDDQSWNQSYAYDGSLTDCYSTIDLSHASDSVTWELVKKLFRGTELLRWAWCTRSALTLLPTMQTIELSKFAPMGSALCFPVESLIFAAIAKMSVNLARERGLDVDCSTGVHSKYRQVLTYGDDIILPSYACNICIDILKHCGFSPNESKSYLHGPFKESCGVNFFCGVDITPLKFSPKYKHDGHDINGITPKVYMSLCSLANLAYEHQHKMLRLSFIKELLDNGFKPLFTSVKDCSPAIYSPTPTNFHLHRRYNKDRVRKTDYQSYSFEYDNISLKLTLTHRTMAYRALLERVRYIAYWDNIPDKQILTNGYCPDCNEFDNDTLVSALSMQSSRVCITKCRSDA